MSIPCSILSRASTENLTPLAAMSRSPPCCSIRLPLGLDDAQQVGLLHDQVVLIVDPDLGARPLAEQHPVTRLDIEPLDLAPFVPGAGADGDHLAFLRLLLGGVRDDDAACGLGFLLDPADHHAIVKWTELHRFSSRGSSRCGWSNWHSRHESANELRRSAAVKLAAQYGPYEFRGGAHCR